MKRILCFAVLFVSAAWMNLGFSQTADELYEQGQQHYERREYEKAFTLIEQAATAGSIDAKFALSKMYREGLGVETSEHQFFLWDERARVHQDYEASAILGVSLAQHNLGWMYYNGVGVAQDYFKAREWYEKAAALGFAPSQYYLGTMYENGVGVPEKDMTKAYQWYEKAAAQGYAKAQDSLGWMYVTGQGVSQELGQDIAKDDAKALALFEKAAAQNDFDMQNYTYNNSVDAYNHLGWMYATGRGVKQDIPQAMAWYEKAKEYGHWIAKLNLMRLQVNSQDHVFDNAQAIEWTQKEAVAQKDGEMLHKLGWMYEQGVSVVQDYAKAIEWYEKAAKQGYERSQQNLEFIMKIDTANVMRQDSSKAIEWFEKTAPQGRVEDVYYLGTLYFSGDDGLRRDEDKGLMLIKEAADRGYAVAQVRLGSIYERHPAIGEGEELQALYWYEKAAAQGDANAYYALGEFYYYGKGSIRYDHDKAAKWLELAFAQGVIKAGYHLGEIYSRKASNYWYADDYAQAVEWYEKAAFYGDGSAAYRLGEMYLEGKGTDKNQEKAKELFEQACHASKNEYRDACDALEKLGK